MAAEAPQEKPADGPSEATPAEPRGLRALVKRRFKLVLAAGLGLVLLVGGLTAWLLLTKKPEEKPAITVQMALDALDEGKFDDARAVVEQVRAGEKRQEGLEAFVLGVCDAREADRAWGAQRGTLQTAAIGHLQEAQSCGVLESRRADLLFWLGKCLCETRQYAASRRLLAEAVQLDEDRAAEIHLLLAASYQRDVPAESLKQNDVALNSPRVSPSQRERGLLQRAELFLTLGRPEECQQTIALLSKTAKAVDQLRLLEGRLLLEEARRLAKAPGAENEAAAKYQDAIAALRKTVELTSVMTPSAQKAMYLIGMTMLEQGDRRGAMGQFARAAAMDRSTPEAVAANFELAELARQAQRDNEAMLAYRRALRAIRNAETYDNPWLPLDALRRRTLSAYQQALDARKYDWCLELAKMLAPAFPEARATQLEAEVYRVWGRELLGSSEQLAPESPAVREGQSRLRSAGEAYERLAKLRILTHYYADDLWESAIAYFEGHDFRSAAKMFREYLKHDSRRRQAAALAGLGRSLLALERTEEAQETFRRCLSLYPRDAASFAVRVAAARVYLERNEIERAEPLLQENLTCGAITPASREWRESLFVLGELLAASGRWPEAIERLDEAVQRYGDGREALSARYLIAECHYRIAQAESKRLEKDVLEQSRMARLKRMRDEQALALAQYRRAHEALERYQSGRDLRPLEKAMLRNCHFCEASLLFELGQYEDAAKVYTQATVRYQHAPEVLEAYVQLARSYRMLDRASDARAAVEQARAVLARMKPETDFQETTIRSRGEWESLLARAVQ